MAELGQKRFASMVRMLRIAYPQRWETHLRNLGVTSFDVAPADLDRIMERVFRMVPQAGIANPAAWIKFDMDRVEAASESVESEAPPKVAVRQNPVELEPVELVKDLAKTSGASPLELEMASVIDQELSWAKLSIGAGERREAANFMYNAYDQYGASQQKIAAAVGKSQAWVSCMLRWHRKGFKATPFGPASKDARMVVRFGPLMARKLPRGLVRRWIRRTRIGPPPVLPGHQR
jgi:hypothetical protein